MKIAEETYTFASPSLPALVLAALCAVAVLFARQRRWPLYGAALIGWLAFGMWPAIIVASYYAASGMHRGGRLGAYAVAAGSAIVAPELSSARTGRWAELVRRVRDRPLALLVGLPMVWAVGRARREVRGGATVAEGLRRERRPAPSRPGPRSGPASPGRCTTWSRTGWR